MASIWDAAKQYFRDAMPGGVLNPEVSKQGILDTAAISLSPVPLLGDAVGLLADANRYVTDPRSRTPENYGLSAVGLLPFVPSMAGIVKPSVARKLGVTPSLRKVRHKPSTTQPGKTDTAVASVLLAKRLFRTLCL